MKKNTILLSLLCCVVTITPLLVMEGHSSSLLGKRTHADRMSTQSFKENLKTILDDNVKILIEKLYKEQEELDDDLATGGIFNQEELRALFEIAKELKLPIIVATNSHGICKFKICRGQSIQELTLFKVSGLSFGDDSQKLRKLFISNHFSHLGTIIVSDHLLTQITLPNELLNLKCLHLGGNQLTELKLPDQLPNLELPHLENNQLTDLKLPNELPNLKAVGLNENQLTEIKLPNELPDLKAVGLNENQLTEIKLPNELLDLKYLSLGGNQLTELKLPDQLPNLQILRLNSNQLNHLTLPKISPETRNNPLLWNFYPIQTVTAFYNDRQHIFQNEYYETIVYCVKAGELPQPRVVHNGVIGQEAIAQNEETILNNFTAFATDPNNQKWMDLMPSQGSIYNR